MGSIQASANTPSVPIVDLSPFTDPNSSVEERQHTAQDLASKLKIDGCIGIKGHGIPASMIEQGFETSRKLFDLPYEEKMKAPHPAGIIPHRGYTGMGIENGGAKGAFDSKGDNEKAKLAKQLDYKESYEIGSDENTLHYNIWLPEETFPGFREVTTKLYWRIHEAAEKILDAIIMSLNLTETEVEKIHSMHGGRFNQLRLLHYPPIPKDLARDNSTGDKSVCRLAQHKDWSSFTILWQKNATGLEYLNRETGNFMPTTLEDGIVWLNIGDMIERMSNGLYPSAAHRVVANRSSDATSRYSMPFFFSPSPDAYVEALPTSVAATTGKPRYETIKISEYKNQMLKLVRKDAN